MLLLLLLVPLDSSQPLLSTHTFANRTEDRRPEFKEFHRFCGCCSGEDRLGVKEELVERRLDLVGSRCGDDSTVVATDSVVDVKDDCRCALLFCKSLPGFRLVIAESTDQIIQ